MILASRHLLSAVERILAEFPPGSKPKIVTAIRRFFWIVHLSSYDHYGKIKFVLRTNHSDILLAKGIRPSPQRLAVYELLVGRKDHPSADRLFRELRKTMPTMSKTTVLNTMRLLQRVGLIRDVRCEEGELRFDGNAEFHAHFKCRECGALFDVPIKEGHRNPYATLPKGFTADDEQLIYYGFCDKCSKKKGIE